MGENLNQEVGRTIVQASSSVLAGTATATTMFGRMTLMWTIYYLRSGLKRIAKGGEKRAEQIRDIATHLEEGLQHFFMKNQNDMNWFNLI